MFYLTKSWLKIDHCVAWHSWMCFQCPSCCLHLSESFYWFLFLFYPFTIIRIDVMFWNKISRNRIKKLVVWLWLLYGYCMAMSEWLCLNGFQTRKKEKQTWKMTKSVSMLLSDGNALHAINCVRLKLLVPTDMSKDICLFSVIVFMLSHLRLFLCQFQS